MTKIFGAEPIATTTAGQVRGQKNGDVFVFKGIPYGGDTAPRRFRAPVPHDVWSGIRDCTQFGPIAPQPAGTSPTAFRHADLPESEDCLNLNLWTPALHDGRQRPVFVYFHGGGFDSQSADLIDGTALTRRGDVVTIGVNHRLGGFGYLYLGELGGPDYAESGNVGQLDLVLALRWVQENVAEFGGDPHCVTIFGDSGGAGKCAALMAMPAARGLFQRVWSISGSLVNAYTPPQATALTRKVLTSLALTAEQLSKFKTVTRQQLVIAFGKPGFAPVVDGTVLPRNPFEPDASPLSATIPMVIGTTHDEMTSFLVKNPALHDMTWAKVREALRVATHPSADEIIAGYERLYPDYSPTEVFHAAVTAGGIWKGINVEAERRAQQGGPTWTYCLTWPGRGKAAHAIDTPLVIGDPTQNWRTNQESTAKEMAEIMSDSFLAFGRTGDPTTSALPRWPRFNLEQRPTMIFDLPPHLENDPRSGERKLFETKAAND